MKEKLIKTIYLIKIFVTHWHYPFLDNFEMWLDLLFDRVTPEDFWDELLFFNLYPEEDFFDYYRDGCLREWLYEYLK